MLIKRNLLVFFRDRASVFFSLLAVFIIIALYILFLGDAMENSLREQLGFESDKIGVAMAGITMAGLAAVTSVTSSMGALGISVEDRKNPAKDFYTSPASRGRITFAYLVGSGTVGFIMTAFALTLSVAWLTAGGGFALSPVKLLMLLFTTVLSVLCGNAMVYFAVACIKSTNAFSAFSTIVGTLIGFLMGIYIPIGSLPVPVQWVIKCFPMSHAASMFRQIIAGDALTEMFAAAPPEALSGFREIFGVTFSYGGYTSGFWFSAAVLAFACGVFYLLSLLVMRRKRV
jgi:multidrug/hemolysin transport system permease protein